MDLTPMPLRFRHCTALVAALALAALLAGCSPSKRVGAAAVAGDLPDQETSDFVLTETDKGHPVWTLYARSAAIYNARNEIVGRGVRVDFFDDQGKRSSQLTAREGSYAAILLSSGEIRLVHLTCRATIGRLGNLEHQNIKLGKAGRSRHLGIRPYVRGTAMNPVDHPHGGGEGRTKGGRHPCSPTAVPAKGGRRRRKNHPTNKFIMKSRHKR